jgi:hypothetical protein
MDIPKAKANVIEIAPSSEAHGAHFSMIGTWEDVPEEEQCQLADKQS